MNFAKKLRNQIDSSDGRENPFVFRFFCWTQKSTSLYIHFNWSSVNFIWNESGKMLQK